LFIFFIPEVIFIENPMQRDNNMLYCSRLLKVYSNHTQQ
jgi:hypothetical protein